MISAAVIGATGYAGQVLVELLEKHPEVDLVAAASRSHAGASLVQVVPGAADILLQDPDLVRYQDLDVLFLCLPHGASMNPVADALEAGARVIDLSADFRLKDPKQYEAWYGSPHQAAQLLGNAVYGLTEINRSAIAGAQLIANPGCYPTSVLLGLYPLLQANLSISQIIIDAKSGVSGAGRTPKQATHFVEVAENIKPYNTGRSHRHIPEMEQALNEWGIENPNLVFTPHLIPIRRGLLASIYVQPAERVSMDQLNTWFQSAYESEPFIDLLPGGGAVSPAIVNGTNRCAIGWQLAGGIVFITVAIDNLIKGASGQAIQNMNAMFGLQETLGLIK